MNRLKQLFAASAAMIVSLAGFAGTTTGVYVNGVSVGDNTSGKGWTLSDNKICLTGGYNSEKVDYTISGTDSTKKLGILVKGVACNVTADNLVLAPEIGGAYVLDNSAYASCHLTFKGTCSFTSAEKYAGIEVPENTGLYIYNDGSAKLIAKGGKYGAGIGGAHNNRAPGAIRIFCDSDGTIEATGNWGAGIGGGMKYCEKEWSNKKFGKYANVYRGGDCNKMIYIGGGVIHATGDRGSAGIGGGGDNGSVYNFSEYFQNLGGSCSQITIGGGHVYASASDDDGADIGSGSGAKAAKGIKILRGTVEARRIGSGSQNTEVCEPVEIKGGTINGVWVYSANNSSGIYSQSTVTTNALVTFGGFAAKSQVSGIKMYAISESHVKTPCAYDCETDLYTDRDGNLHFHLPYGKYQIDTPVQNHVVTIVNGSSPSKSSYSVVTFSAQGGTCATASKSYLNGKIDALPTPTRAGYEFKGWFDYEEYDWCEVGDVVDSHRTLYARWKESAPAETTYTITFDKCEGVGGDDSVQVQYNVKCADIDVPTRFAYTFAGYYDSTDLATGVQYYDQNGKMVKVWDKKADGTLYARWTAVAGKTPKAVLSDAGKTLTFVYTSAVSGTEGTDWFSGESTATPAWSAAKSTVTKVVFDETYHNYKPNSCYGWFSGFEKLQTIENLKYLDTSKVTTMGSMFYHCYALETIDLSGFDTSSLLGTPWMFGGCSTLTELDLSRFNTTNVTSMVSMFRGCSALKKITVSALFDVSKVTSSANMFTGCSTSLKGGNGTVWSAGNAVDKTYARIDKVGQAGYFTVAKTACELVDGVVWRYKVRLGEYDGEDGVQVWDSTPIPANGKVTVPATLGGFPVRAIASVALAADKGAVSSVEIPEGVWQLDANAFCEYSHLTTVKLPKSLKTITGTDSDFGVFAKCVSLKTVDIPADSQLESIGYYAFKGCSSLKFIELPKSVETIDGGVFQDCTSLYSVTLHGEPKGTFKSAFSGCTALQFIYVDEGKVDTIKPFLINASVPASAQITDIDWHIGSWDSFKTAAIYGCDNADGTVKIPRWIDGGLVKSISDYAIADFADVEAFAVESDNAYFSVVDGVLYDKAKTELICCPGAKTGAITIPSTVTTIRNLAFAYCTKLTAINVAADNAAFVSVNGVVYNKPAKDTLLFCPAGQTELVVPTSLKTVSSGAFRNCTKLVLFTRGDSGTVCNFLGVGGAPDTATGFAYTIYEDAGTTYASIVGADMGEAGTLTLPDKIGDWTVGKISGLTFKDCTDLKSVKLPANLKVIGNQAFEGCTALASITLPSSLETIGRDAFKGCGSLKSVTVPGKVSSMEGAFDNCTGLETAVLQSGVSLVDDSMFSGCTALKSVTLPATVTAIGNYAFQGCSALASLALPSGLKTIGKCAFKDCTALTAIDLPTGLTGIGESAFSGCESLAAVTIPASVTEVGEYAFNKCTKLKSVTLSEGVVTLGSYAFGRCTALTSIDLPASIVEMQLPFAESENLSAINVNAANATYASVDGVLYNKSKTDLITYPPARTGTCNIASGVTTIRSGAFAYSKVETVNIPASVTTVPCDLMNGHPFLMATKLKAITVNAANAQFTSVDGILYNKAKTRVIACPMAKTGAVEIPSGVTSIDQFAFVGSAAASVTIPKTVTGIGIGAFLEVEIDDKTMQGVKKFYVEEGDVTRISKLLEASYLDMSAVKVLEIGTPDPDPNPTPDPDPAHVIPTLFDSVVGAAVNIKGMTYNGFIGEDTLGGTFTLVYKKPKKGATTVAATMTRIDPKTGKKVKVQGTVDINTGVCSGGLAGITLGEKGLTGTFDGSLVQGAVDAAKAKDKDSLALMNTFNKKAYALVVSDTAGNTGMLTVSMSTKGKAKVKGTVAGSKVSGSAQMSVGDRCAVSFVYAKKNVTLTFVLWLDKAGTLLDVSGLGTGVKLVAAGSADALSAGNYTFTMDKEDVLAAVPDAIAAMPFSVGCAWNGKKFTLAKAAKVKYDKKSGQVVVDTSKGDNVSGLALKLSKGTLSGSFTVYGLTGTKLTKNKFTVSGIVIDGVGYATATNKKLGAIACEITK